MDDAADRALVARRARAVAVAATALLIVLGAAWELWVAPTGSGTLSLKVVPLFFALPGLVRMRLYTYRWLSLAIWLYAAEGAVRATSDRGASASLAIAELVLALVLFAACCVHVRAQLHGGAAAGARP
jgi:uncharacterized membrane protein